MKTDMFTTSNKTFKCPKFSGHSELSWHWVHGSVIVMLREYNWDLKHQRKYLLHSGYGFGRNPLLGTLRVRISLCFPQQVNINIVAKVNIFLSDGEGGQSFPLQTHQLESPYIHHNVQV